MRLRSSTTASRASSCLVSRSSVISSEACRAWTAKKPASATNPPSTRASPASPPPAKASRAADSPSPTTYGWARRGGPHPAAVLAHAAVAAHQGPATKASRSGIAASAANRGHHTLGSAAERTVSPSRASSTPRAIAAAVGHAGVPAATWAAEAQTVTATSSRRRERSRADHRRVIRPSSSASGGPSIPEDPAGRARRVQPAVPPGAAPEAAPGVTAVVVPGAAPDATSDAAPGVVSGAVTRPSSSAAAPAPPRRPAPSRRPGHRPDRGRRIVRPGRSPRRRRTAAGCGTG